MRYGYAFKMATLGALMAAVVLGSCSLDLDPEPEVVRPLYDLSEGEIPMPNDLVRDDEAGMLDLPTDDEDLTEAERQLYEQLNTLDGWPSTYQQKLKFSGSVAADTVDEDTVQVWRWGADPERVDLVFPTLQQAGTELYIDAPKNGWLPSTRYVVLVRGGENGVRGALNQPMVADPSFYFVRVDQPLNVPEHMWAFPGDDRAERLENGEDLEEVRLELKPYFDYFDSIGVPRSEVAALWSFTTTGRAELAMDEASQRMPLPANMLLDPDTDKVHLPIGEDDSQLRADAKRQVNGLDGFGLSSNLLFESTRPLDPATVTAENVALYELGGMPREIETVAWLMADGIHVVIEPAESPLKEQTSYGIVIFDGIQSAEGSPLVAMPAGMLLKLTTPIYADGESQIGVVDDAKAQLLESVRVEVAPLLDQIGRDNVVTAWSFRTQSVLAPLLERVNAAEDLGLSVDPVQENVMTPGEALLDFVIGISSILDVEEIWHGTIESPVYLDPITRGFREDGTHRVEDIAFTMTIPQGADRDTPIPTVVFGHGLMTERRFVLALGDYFARKGFAVIAIDLPYHGTRTHCKRGGPMSIPHPLTGELIDLDPCKNGTTCAADGRCVDGQGNGGYDDLAMWPVINYPMASGSAFLEVEELAHTRDHFTQGLIDLHSLMRTIRHGDWRNTVGWTLDSSSISYVGQSLGGILGGTMTSINPDIQRAVWNVPGCDVVDMFDTSTYFAPQVAAFFQREAVNRTSYEAELFFDVARWIMDSVDPHSVAHLVQDSGQAVLIQLAQLDFIIPNWSTYKLQSISGVPLIEYLAEHAFLTIPGEPAYFAGAADAADFINGDLLP